MPTKKINRSLPAKKAAPAKSAGKRTVTSRPARTSAKAAPPLPRGSERLVDDDVGREGIRLSFLIHDVSRMRRRAYDQFMKPLRVTRAQWWVLAHLSRHDGMMQTQLAEVLDVGKASLGDVVGSLEAAGLVDRRADPSDKRARRVYLTRRAQALIKRMTRMEVDFNEQILAAISPEERLRLIDSLTHIKAALAEFVSSGRTAV